MVVVETLGVAVGIGANGVVDAKGFGEEVAGRGSFAAECGALGGGLCRARLARCNTCNLHGRGIHRRRNADCNTSCGDRRRVPVRSGSIEINPSEAGIGTLVCLAGEESVCGHAPKSASTWLVNA